MAKIDLSTLTSGYYSTQLLNANFEGIETTLNDLVLFRDPGAETNEMLSELDMNSNRILNLPEPVNPNDAARLQDVTTTALDPNTIIATQAEAVTLTAGQLTVDFPTYSTTGASFNVSGPDVDDARLVLGRDFSVPNDTSILLTQSYPAGTLIQSLRNAVGGEEIVDASYSQSETKILADSQTTVTFGTYSTQYAGFYISGTDVDSGRLALSDYILLSNTSIELSQSYPEGTTVTLLRNSSEAGVEREIGQVSVKDFGAVGDGVTDDTAAFQAAETSDSDYIYIPSGEYLTTFPNYNSLNKTYLGEGKIVTIAGKMPENYSHGVSTLVEGSPASLLTAFNGDTTNIIDKAGQSHTFNVLTAPTTGYKFVVESALEYHYTTLNSAVGHNEELGGNDGRTGYIQNKGKILHQGQGDAIVNHADVTVTGQKAGATHFLASPAGVLYGGSLTSANGLNNLTVGEILLYDNANDCRGTGFVLGFERDNNTGANSNFWSGQRLVSKGTKPCDSGYQVVGTWKIGVDLATADIENTGAAVAISANDVIEFHAEAPADSAGIKRYAETLNGYTAGYSSTTGSLDISAGSGKLKVFPNYTTVNPAVQSANAFRVYGTGNTTSYLSMGTSNNACYINAASDSTDNTTLEFRTSSAGTEATGLKINALGILNSVTMPTYADDSAAGTGGLGVGDIYKTATGELRIKL